MFKPLHHSRCMLTVVASAALLVGRASPSTAVAPRWDIDPPPEPRLCRIVWMHGDPFCALFTAGATPSAALRVKR
jgi:hypothetical protein